MTTVPIAAVTLDPALGLLVVPGAGAAFPYVYRDASGVTWLSALGALAGREPARWDPVLLYRQILAAVRNEYGALLTLSEQTDMTQLDPSLREAITASGPVEPVVQPPGREDRLHRELAEQATIRARDAFRAGQPAAAAQLLAPHAAVLSAAGRRLLEMCRRQTQ